MKSREEISAMLNGYIDASPDEQAQLMTGILDEYETAINESSAYTAGVPEGASNWHEAYDNLRKDYVKAFFSSNQPSVQVHEPSPKEISVDDAAKAFVNQMFGRK